MKHSRIPPDKKYFRAFKFSIDEAKPLVYTKGTNLVWYDGWRIQIHHRRLQTFYHDGPSCRACKIRGLYFYAECDRNNPHLVKWHMDENYKQKPTLHLNLYGIDPRTQHEMMMTSDHVIPYSMGGSNGLSNRCNLCYRCNQLKGNDPDWLTDLPRDRNGRLHHRRTHQVVFPPEARKKRPDKYYA